MPDNLGSNVGLTLLVRNPRLVFLLMQGSGWSFGSPLIQYYSVSMISLCSRFSILELEKNTRMSCPIFKNTARSEYIAADFFSDRSTSRSKYGLPYIVHSLG